MFEAFHPRRIITGMIFTAFIITPAIADPSGFFSSVGNWITSVQPYFTELIGGVI